MCPVSGFHNTTIPLNLKKGSRPLIRVSVVAKHIELKSLKEGTILSQFHQTIEQRRLTFISIFSDVI